MTRRRTLVALLSLLVLPGRALAVEAQYLEGHPLARHLRVAAPPIPAPGPPPAAPVPPASTWLEAAPDTGMGPTPVTTSRMSLPAAVSQAVERSPSVRSAIWGQAVARRDVSLAEAARMPVVRATGLVKDSNLSERYLLLGPVGEILSDIAADSAAIAGVSAQVPLYLGGLLTATASAARAGEEAAGVMRRLAVQETIYRTVEAYLDVLVESNAVKLEERRLEQKDHEIRTARERATERFALQQQVLALELQANETRQDRLEAQNRLGLARSRLLNELGLPSTSTVDIDPRVGLRDLPPDLEVAVERARRGNLRLAAMVAQIQAAKDKVGIAGADEKPSLNLQWDYYHTRPFQNPDDSYDNWEVKLLGQIRLFDGGQSHHKRIRAVEELRQLEVQAASVRQQVELGVRQAWARYTEAQGLLGTLDDSIRLAREMLRFIEERVAARVLLEDSLLKARVDLLDAQQTKFFVHAALLKARAALLLAMGDLTPDAVVGP